MIKLKRLLLIHWQAYDFQIIDFDQITLITGQTGVGKSTIIDALNVVLLGEKNKRNFNKAANENSSRTIDSYLYGKLGDDGGEGFTYLREGNFTSYVVAEFENEDSQEHFCCGLVADCAADLSTPRIQWITFQSGLPEDHFLDRTENLPYSINELINVSNSRDEKQRITFTTIEREYRKSIAGLFGNIRDDYRRLLKQSVSFTPVKNIETFLTDFVSETENVIDVEEMQKSIRRYNDLQEESDRIKRKVERLEVIKGSLKRLDNWKFTELRQIFIIEKAKLDGIKEEELLLKEALKENEEQVEHQKQMLLDDLERVQEIYKEKEKAQIKRDSLAVLKDKTVLNDKISHVVEQLEGICKSTDKSIEGLNLVKEFSLELDKLPKDVFLDKSMKNRFLEFEKESEIIANFSEINELMGNVLDVLNNYKYSVSQKKAELESRISLLKQDRKKLNSNIKIVPKQLSDFREKLQTYLSRKGQSITVDYLADVIDFKPGEENWHQSIEAYLGRQKDYLVIDPKFYNEALRFYKLCQKDREVYGIGIINLGKMKNRQFDMGKNSLANKIVTENPLVRTFINFLLGRVVACDDVMELSKYHTAITSDGFLYKGFVTRKLQFGKLRMSIGSSAIEQQLLQVNKQIEEYEIEKNNLDKKIERLKKIANFRKLDSFSCDLVIEYADKKKLLQKQKELDNLQEKLSNLDDKELIEIEEKIEKLGREESRLNISNSKIEESLAKLQLEIEKISQVEIPECIQSILEQQRIFDSEFADSEYLTAFDEAYRSALNSEYTHEAVGTHYKNNLIRTRTSIQETEDELKSLMLKYNQDFDMSLPITIEQSRVYEEEYDKYVQSELPKFELDIADMKEKTIKEFRYQFIDRLRGNFENLDRQVGEINDALRNRKFGEDTYRFKVGPNESLKEYYDMIMDDMLIDDVGDWNLLSATFESKYAKQIEMLFNILSGEDLDEGGNKESRIKLFSDYKNYLSFDMIIKRGEQIQRLSKTYTFKSGGETQIPLYISLLAAFSQVYRVRNTRRNNTIRLIIMDEAFNKIDGEKIKQCIQMIKDFDLQAIFSTPPEKIPEIMEEADKALVVLRKGNQASVQEFSSMDELVEEPHEL